ncbi:MAG TPA: GTP 3',8-cyclase MoaA [Pirellulaceae bacterium]|nr:GTP 3',8-cyclase MoaA [Pirellulaceae bacterium]HMO93662.1 GTP 3',8-cyclase MoaA [Pirellulaceae bacterium]HMP70666.1 GTP 3',8-cyclase MoaA [Pirellulaceae bacterium]
MQLIDSFGRVHSNLRISVTDRCNIRCTYCMPEHVKFLPRREILTYAEICRIAKIFADLGVSKIRLTGGEPLLRRELHKLVAMLREIDRIEEIALTTNALLLSEQAQDLKRAGLDRINISLDSVDELTFQKIARRSGLHKVFEGISVAQEVGFKHIRINAVALKNLSEDSIVPLAKFCAERGLHLRFIEYMPLDGEKNWGQSSVLSGAEILRRLVDEYGEVSPVPRDDPSQPAVDYVLSNGLRVGFINSVTQPFCGDCNRLRLTAEGQMRNCLFSTVDFDLRELVRKSADDATIQARIVECVQAKKFGHGINSDEFERPKRAMYQIGG